MSRLRIAIVGMGVISRFYLAALDQSETAELAGACDLSSDALEPHRGNVPCYQSHTDLLERADDIDAVIVNVPNDAHLPVCHDVINAGLPVCVEKPLTTRLDDGVGLADLARARGVPLFTAFHRRYNDNVLRLLRGLPPGVPIDSVSVRYLERIEEHVGHDQWYLDPDSCGGGCVADNGPNAFDLVRLFLGEVTVEDAAIQRDQLGTDRQATVRLRAGNGATAEVTLDWSYPGEGKDITVRLANGDSRRADMLAGYPGFKDSLWHEYSGILADFRRCVLSGEDCSHGGLAALQLVDASYVAAAQAAGRPEGN